MPKKKQSELTKARKAFYGSKTGQVRGNSVGQSPFQRMKAAELKKESKASVGKEIDPRFNQLSRELEAQVASGQVAPDSHKRWLRSANETRLSAEIESEGDVYAKATGALV